jgi:hypothetical protein
VVVVVVDPTLDMHKHNDFHSLSNISAQCLYHFMSNNTAFWPKNKPRDKNYNWIRLVLSLGPLFLDGPSPYTYCGLGFLAICLVGSYWFEFKCDTNGTRKRSEPGSLGWATDALANSATPLLLDHCYCLWKVFWNFWLICWLVTNVCLIQEQKMLKQCKHCFKTFKSWPLNHQNIKFTVQQLNF